ncbi:M28 family metallopeptidase [Paenibacillus sp. FSL H7-0714]|uniref:M28 family metallopeptidase n=1 Tax=Paenibacillus sp. FSL H7-0714 TaxID=2954735 RepID=UPI0030F848E6
MSTNIRSIIFLFDQSFGMLRFSEKSEVVGVDFLPGIITLMESLQRFDVEMFLFLPEASESVENLNNYFPQFNRIVIYQNKNVLQQELNPYLVHANSTILVSSDRVLRSLAAELGFISTPHPQVALNILNNKISEMVLIFGSKEQCRSISDGLPYFYYKIEDNRWCMLSVMVEENFSELQKNGIRVEKLSIDLSTEDPIFVEIEEWNKETVEILKKHKVLSIEGRKIIVALGPTELNESLHVHGPNGHAHPQLLLPSPEMLYPVNDFRNDNKVVNNTDFSELNMENITASTPESFEAIVKRYSGKLDIDHDGPIKSRHVLHPDNVRVINALQQDLSELGLCPTVHRFNLNGISLNNVIADLPGIVPSSFELNVKEKLRELFQQYPNPMPIENWLPSVKNIVGNEWFTSKITNDANPIALRRSIEDSVGLSPWYPWWLQSCALPDSAAKLIIVGCHLDSTAANDSIYHPDSDPAPGADDDASGIAAVLSIAKCLLEYKERLTHTVRFCFFNAEESGLVGSKVYASMLKATGAPVKAAICIDMIGFNSDQNHLFEIHAGHIDADIRNASLPIAQTIANHVVGVPSLSPPQIYQGTSTDTNPDRTLFDGAIGRSDHASFHQQGYPAVVVSEDFFINFPSEPVDDPNPNYHHASDLFIDASYGSSITNVLANAVLELARK